MKEEEILIHTCTVGTDNKHCFEKLTDEEMLLLEENKLEVTYKKGEIICKQGAFASHIIYMCHGFAKVYIENGNDILTLKVVPDGNFIGLSSLSDNNNVPSYVYAIANNELGNIMEVIEKKKGQNLHDADYYNPMSLFVFSMDFAPSFSSFSMARIQSTFSGMTSDS